MYVANDLRKKNIIEYLLYMWQIEDLIRACNFDINEIKIKILSRYNCNSDQYKEIQNWYEGISELMISEKIQNTGHLSFLNNIVSDLNYIHLRLINNPNEVSYAYNYKEAKPIINELRNKMSDNDKNDIEVCLNGLYGYLVLRLQKKDVTEATKQAMVIFNKFLSQLAYFFHQIEEGKKKI